jgi:hypothetical protein
MVRCMKQGIDYSIANHLEYLTSKWPNEEQLSEYTKNLYRRGEEMCKTWANLRNESMQPAKNDENFGSPNDHVCVATYDDTSVSTSSSSSSNEQANEQDRKKDRSYFDHNMYDTLERILILKVFSHQLNRVFTKKNLSTQPSPNLCVVSANQYTDNAATQAREIINTLPREFEAMFYPPFSPRWSFTFNGCTTNKGATKVFKEKLDEELDL